VAGWRERVMRVSEIRITNFRCVAEATYRLNDSTALVGSNGAGKSTLIRALLLFYDGIARPSEGDHFNGDTTHPIEIQVSFTQLSENEREELRDLIDADGNLKITLRARIADGGRPDVGYYVHRRRYPAFETVRAAASAAERQEAAKALQQTDLSMYDFEIGRSWSLTDESLRAWEERNPELCEVVLTQVSLDPPNQPESRLYPFTQLVFVPAVRDAADEAVEGRGNLMSRLIDMAVGDISATPEFQDANRDFKNRYQSLVQTTSERLLPRLQDRIETALRQYAPGVCVRLQWSGADVRLIAPQAIAYLDDGGFLGDVPSKGHGLQRLFIVALLQAASELLRRSSDSGNAEE